MADATVGTASSFSGVPESVIWGETVAINKAVFEDTSTTPVKWKLADGDTYATIGGGARIGVSMTGGVLNERGLVAATPGGVLTLAGATFVVGGVYVVSLTAGGIAPIADISTGDFVAILGVAVSATALQLILVTSSVAKA